MEYNELYHHGVKGMKWGVRRTPQQLGHKVVSKWKRKRAANKAEAEAKAKAQAAKNKKPSEMTNEELNERIKHLELEQRYNSLMTQTGHSEKGRSFAKDFLEKSIKPAATEAGKELIKGSLMKLGKKALGLNDNEGKDYVDVLAKEVKKLNLEKQYKRLKEERDTEKSKEKINKEEPEFDKKSKEKLNKEDSDFTKRPKDEPEYYEGEVIGGSFKKSHSTSGKRAVDDIIIDADWEPSSSETSTGRTYVSGLLDGSSTLALPAPRKNN